MINVVIYASTWDTGGQGYRIKRAFDRYEPEFCVRSIHTSNHFFDYPHDQVYEPRKVYPLFSGADVLHFRNDLGGYKRLGGGKPTVLHYHGTIFRERHAEIAATARDAGSIQLASTLDLTLLEPDIEWLPSPFDLDELASYRLVRRPTAPIRIAHAPTNRSVKSTLRVMAAVENLWKRGYDVVLDLIERKPWHECLTRKGKADIYVDQLHLGYGNNAIEAWSMGIPVIAGVSDPDVREAMVSRWGILPFREATEGDLEDRLAELIVDADFRTYWASVGVRHVQTYHDERKVVKQLAEVYRRAASSAQAAQEVLHG